MSMFKRGIKYNLRYYTWYYLFMGFIFTIPIWVAFYTRIITLQELALITALESIVVIILEVPTGALADLIGRRVTVAIGILIRAIWAFAMPFAGGFSAVLGISLLGALGETFLSGADSALLYDSLKEQGKEAEFGQTYTKLLTYYRAGLILASLAAGSLFTLWYGAPYFARGITFLLAFGGIMLCVEPKIDSEKFSWSRYLAQTKQGIRELTSTPFVKKLTSYYIVVGAITWSCLLWFIQPFGYDFGWTPQQMSYLTAGYYFVVAVVLYLVTSAKGLLTRQRVYLGFPILMTLALLPGLVVGKYLAVGLMVLAQLAGSSRFAILDKYVNKEFSSKNRATALSTLNMAVSFLVAGLIFVGGQLQGMYDTRTVFSLLGLISIMIVTPLGLILVNDHKQYLAQKALVHIRIR